MAVEGTDPGKRRGPRNGYETGIPASGELKESRTAGVGVEPVIPSVVHIAGAVGLPHFKAALEAGQLTFPINIRPSVGLVESSQINAGAIQ